MIEGINIKKSFDDRVLFDNFNFKIADGEFVCFSGESGSGKTTLLNIIGLLEPIDAGELLINGKQYKRSKDIRKYYQNEVGFLFQNFALIENKTVRQNLDIVKMDMESDITIPDALKWVGLEDKLYKKVYTLSGGEQQRIALARLLIKPCNIVLADEPTGSLDERNAASVMKMLRQLNELGKTVILVTHDEGIKKQADRIIRL